MSLRATRRRDEDGSVVRYRAPAENGRHPAKGRGEARVVHSFGWAGRLDRAVPERLAASLRRVLAATDGAPVVERSGAGEIEAVVELGVAPVVEALWQRLGIAAAIAARIAAKQPAAPQLAALLAMALQRLERPGSKLACHGRWLAPVWLPAARDLALGRLHRARDLLAGHGDAIGQAVLWTSVDPLEFDADLVFGDATTARFETGEADPASHPWRGPDFDPLRQRGPFQEGRDKHPPQADDPSLPERASGDGRGDP